MSECAWCGATLGLQAAIHDGDVFCSNVCAENLRQARTRAQAVCDAGKTKKTMSRSEELATQHWDYVEGILLAHKIQAEIVDVVGHHYVSAFIHGYKHGGQDWTDADRLCKHAAEMQRAAHG